MEEKKEKKMLRSMRKGRRRRRGGRGIRGEGGEEGEKEIRWRVLRKDNLGLTTSLLETKTYLKNLSMCIDTPVSKQSIADLFSTTDGVWFLWRKKKVPPVSRRKAS